jgi:hypothetical protein
MVVAVIVQYQPVKHRQELLDLVEVEPEVFRVVVQVVQV